MQRYVSGIDLSVTATGIAIAPLDRAAWPPFSTMLVGVDGIQSLSLPVLVATLREQADQIVRAALAPGSPFPEAVLMESPTGSRATGGVFERGYLYYLVVGRFIELGIKVMQASNNQIKQYVTGKGNATKGAVIDGIGRRFPMFETGGHDGRADAAGAAALCAALLDAPLVPDLPGTHRAVVERMLAPAPVKRTRKAAR